MLGRVLLSDPVSPDKLTRRRPEIMLYLPVKLHTAHRHIICKRILIVGFIAEIAGQCIHHLVFKGIVPDMIFSLHLFDGIFEQTATTRETSQ